MTEVLDPIGLLHQLKQLQQAVFRCAAGCSPFVSSPLADPLHVFSVEKCTAGQGFSKVDDPGQGFIRVRDEASDLASDVGHLMPIHQ